MYKDSKIYVAGHKGLLGTALLQRLYHYGYNNIITACHKDLDLTRQIEVDSFFKKEQPEYVFLAAGKVGGIISNKEFPADYLKINLSIQNNIFEAAAKYNIKNVLFYGSSCTYPKKSPKPIKEEYFLTGPIEETSEGYAAAKIAGLLGCRAYNRQYKCNRFIALIPNTIYGPYDNFDVENSHVLSALIRKFHDAKIAKRKEVVLWGSGNPKREFIYSEDVADASIFAAINADKLENRHYNVGTGIDYSIKELAHMISQLIGYSGSIIWDKSKPDGVDKKLLCCTDFYSLGWKPSISLADGINKTYNWFKNIYK